MTDSEKVAQHCPTCPKFNEYVYDNGFETGIRIPDNCSLWLCNNKGCPHE